MPVTRIPAPDGIYTGAGPLAVPKGKASSISNFLVDRPGKLRARGPLGDAVTIFAASTEPTGIWVFGEKLLVSKHPTSKLYDTDAGTVTDDAISSATLQLDGRAARVGSRAFGPSTDASTAILSWSGTGLSDPAPLPEAPEGAADVCSHLERLFVAGGTEPGSIITTPKPSTLWYSDPGGPDHNDISVTGAAATDLITGLSGFANGDRVRFSSLTGGTGLTTGVTYYVRDVSGFDFKLAFSSGGAAINFTTDLSGQISKAAMSWQDDVSGLTNQIAVGEEGDPIVGLASLPNQLLIFKRHSIWTLAGRTPAQFEVRRIAGTVGCVDKRSILVVDQTCFFADGSGLPRAFDGYEMVRLEGIDARMLGSTQVQCIRLPNDHLLWHWVNGNVTGKHMLYVPTRGWSEFSADDDVLNANTSDEHLLATTETGAAFIFDDTVARSLADVPYGASVGNGGVEESISGTSNYIPQCVVTYRVEQLGLPLVKSRLSRVMIDHQLSTSDDSFWEVALRSIDGAATTYNVAAANTDELMRTSNDVFGEYVDVEVEITLQPPSAPLTDPTELRTAELYDVWIEHDGAQRR